MFHDNTMHSLLCLLAIVICFHPLVRGCNTPTVQVSALNDLYTSTNGQYWKNNINWGIGDPCDHNNRWWGVYCNNCNVTGVDLNNNNLSGTIPSTIGKLVYLNDLDLNTNTLSGTIPSTIGNLFLQELDLHKNTLSGTIPPVGCCILQYLYVQDNQFNGSIPAIPFVNYGIYNFSNNKFSCPLPSFCYEYGKATISCEPCYNKTTNEQNLALEHLFNSTNGEKWIDTTNWMNGADPCLSEWYGVACDPSGSITALNLAQNGLSGSIPLNFGQLTGLQIVDLSMNQIGNILPSNMSNLINLQSINIAGNQFIGVLPDFFWKNNLISFSLNATGNQFECPLPSYCTYSEYGGNSACIPCNPQSVILNFTIGSMTAISSGDTEKALKNAWNACNLQDVIKPVNALGTVLYRIACQMANNLNNSMSLNNRRFNAVSQNQWSNYEMLVEDYIGLFASAEMNMIKYYNNRGEEEKLKQLTISAINATNDQLSNWVLRSTGVRGLMGNVTFQMETLNQGIDNITYSLRNPIRKLSDDISADIQKITSIIGLNMNTTFFINSMTEIMMTTAGQICCWYSFVDQDQVVNTIYNQIVAISNCLSLAGAYIPGSQMLTLYPLYENMYNLANAFNSSRNLLNYYARNNETLPYILPNSYLNLVEVHQMNDYIQYYCDRLKSIVSSSSTYPVIDNLGQYADNYITLSFDWYHLAMILQLSESQIELLDQVSTELSSILSNEQLEVLALRHGFGLLWLQKASLQLITVMYLTDETRQLGYASLTNITYSIPYNPTSTQLQSIQTKLDTEITDEEGYTDASNCWTNYTITANEYPQVFKQLWSTGNTTIYVPIPSPQDTKFYQVNMLSVAVAPSPVVAREYIIGVEAIHIGLAQFHDHNFNLWNYTFNPVPYEYYFFSDTECPVSVPYLNPNYIHYSPYGPWKLSFDTDTIDVKNITSIELFFKLAWNLSGGDPNSNFFNTNGRTAGCIPTPRNCK